MPLSDYSLDELLQEIRSRFDQLQPRTLMAALPKDAEEAPVQELVPNPPAPISLTRMDPPSGLASIPLQEVIAANQALNGVENVSLVQIRPANPNIGIQIVSVSGFPEWDSPQTLKIPVAVAEVPHVLRLCAKMVGNPRCSHVPRNCYFMESTWTLHVVAEPSVLAEILHQWTKIYPDNIRASSVYEGLKEVLGTPSEVEFRSRWSQKLLEHLSHPGTPREHIQGISRAAKIISPAFRELAIPEDWYERTNGEDPCGVQRRPNTRLRDFRLRLNDELQDAQPLIEPMPSVEDFFHD